MERVVHKTKNYKEALRYDILQQTRMFPEERMKIAWILKRRYYGKRIKDVRESKKWNKGKIFLK